MMKLMMSAVMLPMIASAPEMSAQSAEIVPMMKQMIDMVTFMILAVAVPNGAYGMLEWMTGTPS